MDKKVNEVIKKIGAAAVLRVCGDIPDATAEEIAIEVYSAFESLELATKDLSKEMLHNPTTGDSRP